MTEHTIVRNKIELLLKRGYRKFIIFPFNSAGVIAKELLNVAFGIEEEMIVDNRLAEFNKRFSITHSLAEVDWSDEERILLFAYNNHEPYERVKREVQSFVPDNKLFELFPRVTECGHHSYGPLCNHWLVKRVGNYSSFAEGCDVVLNHEMRSIATHPIFYREDEEIDDIRSLVQTGRERVKRVKGDRRPLNLSRARRIIIGSDVWLGKNVIITNGAHIGNGVIAGTGAIITKDVPDYAVVGGCPARIIRYRYSEAQIEALNRIAWWDWPEERIKESSEIFFMDVDAFIELYG